MASNQTGRASIFGWGGGTVAWTGIGTLFGDSAEFSENFDLKKVVDSDNEPQTFIASGRLQECRFQFTPVGSNASLATAKLSLPPPIPLAVVTLAAWPWNSAAGADIPAGGANTATWVYTGGWKLAFTKDGVATYSLMISRSPNRDLSTPVTA